MGGGGWPGLTLFGVVPQEDTQFLQILQEALDFFGIDESEHENYYLVDHKSRKLAT